MSQDLPIYLDYSATAPVDDRVAEKMCACLTRSGEFGNPASRSHAYGWSAERVVEEARAQVADLVGADPREIIWTSGATESDNLALKDMAVSSGSACTSASLEPSYVLRALGRNDELAHSSLRFSLGRYTTEEDVEYTIRRVKEKVGKLRELSPLWEMFQDGVDIDTVQWAAH